MALPPNSFTSHAPSAPPSDSLKESSPEIVPANAESLLPPTDTPAGFSESTPTTPPTQSVTVVVAPTPDQSGGSSWLNWTILGAMIGLGIGLLTAWYYHTKLPGEFESTARLQVTGPPPAGDAATQIATLRSRTVLTAAANKLDEYRPWQMPPDKDEARRIAFLEKGLRVHPESSANGCTLNVAFLAPNAPDAPRYLRAIVDAYKSDVTSRSAAPAASPRSVAPQSRAADLERERLQKELAALTKDDVSVIEKRIADTKARIEVDQAKLRQIDADLALIKAAGTSRRDRLQTMEKLGIKPARPEVLPDVAEEIKRSEEGLKSLQAKKTELSRRLGPEHRDMVALEEEISSLRDRIAKLKPSIPTGSDELDRHRSVLETERKSIVARADLPAEALAANQKLLEDVRSLRKRIDDLSFKSPLPQEPPVKEAALATAVSVETTLPTQDGRRVSPPWEKSLVPGGAIGLIAGGLLGLVVSLLFSGSKSTTRKPVKAYKPLVSPVSRISSPAVPITSGPKLGVPVFANVPKLAGDAPIEKRSGEGLSPTLVVFSRPSSTEAEVFRIARRELTSALHNKGHQAICITSPGPGDGKSFVAANLAISLAQSGKRVLLVDCDLQSSKVQDLFRITRLGDSLRSVMASEVDLRMAVRSCEITNLFLLPAGRGTHDPVDLLTRPKFRELIAELKSGYEYVIIDSPESDCAAEFAAVASVSDGALLVVRSASNALARSDRARNEVIAAGSRVLGAIVNAAPATNESIPIPKVKELAAAK